MKGHIIKDLYISKKMLIFMGAAFMFAVVFSYVFRFAYIYGNLKDKSYSIPTCDIIFGTIPELMCFVFSLAITINGILSDKKEKWNLFLFTTSTNERKIIAVKLAEIFLLVAVGIGMSLAANTIYGLIFGFKHIKTAILISIAAAALSFIANLTAMCLSYKFKSQNLIEGVICAMGFIPAFLLTVYMAFNHPNAFNYVKIMQFYENHSVSITVITVIILLAATVISYFISVKIIKRRHALCGA